MQRGCDTSRIRRDGPPRNSGDRYWQHAIMVLKCSKYLRENPYYITLTQPWNVLLATFERYTPHASVVSPDSDRSAIIQLISLNVPSSATVSSQPLQAHVFITLGGQSMVQVCSGFSQLPRVLLYDLLYDVGRNLTHQDDWTGR